MDKELSILLIEDNPGDAMLIEEYLEEEKEIIFRLTIAESLDDGINTFQNNNFNAVLLDLGLPDATGVGALEKMLGIAHEVPIIVITGLNDEQTGRKAVNMGAQNYLIKGSINRQILTQNIFYSIERNNNIQKIKKHEKRLAEKNKQLDKVNKSKDILISILSHDMRGPINSVKELLGMMVNNFASFTDNEKLEMVSASHKSIQLTSELLETILYWTRSQSGKLKVNPTNVVLRDLVEHAISPLIMSAKAKNINVQSVVDESCRLYADHQMISTVFRNLVSNSIKFSHRNSKIIIGVNANENNQTTIFFKDEGVGIDKEDLEQIFNRDDGFTKLGTEDERGTGFGLILCKEFVEKNNGRINIESTVGEGTTIFVTLPSSID